MPPPRRTILCHIAVVCQPCRPRFLASLPLHEAPAVWQLAGTLFSSTTAQQCSQNTGRASKAPGRAQPCCRAAPFSIRVLTEASSAYRYPRTLCWTLSQRKMEWRWAGTCQGLSSFTSSPLPRYVPLQITHRAASSDSSAAEEGTHRCADGPEHCMCVCAAPPYACRVVWVTT